jgi:hypothetical protein
MTILPKCPSCGLESAEIRCPRCNTLKLVGCSGACASCAASCPSAPAGASSPVDASEGDGASTDSGKPPAE